MQKILTKWQWTLTFFLKRKQYKITWIAYSCLTQKKKKNFFSKISKYWSIITSSHWSIITSSHWSIITSSHWSIITSSHWTTHCQAFRNRYMVWVSEWVVSCYSGRRGNPWKRAQGFNFIGQRLRHLNVPVHNSRTRNFFDMRFSQDVRQSPPLTPYKKSEKSFKPFFVKVWKSVIFGRFWPFSAKYDFSRKIWFGHFLPLIPPYLHAKDQKKVMKQSWEKRQRPYFRPFLPQRPKIRIFPKNRAPSVFIIYGPLTSCKKSEKSNEPILRKVRCWQTDGLTEWQKQFYRIQLWKVRIQNQKNR